VRVNLPLTLMTLTLDQVTLHTHHTSLIDLYLHAKFH